MGTMWRDIILWGLLGYLIGSISFAYLSARIFRGLDLRRQGSGKLSGSNVYYYLGTMGLVMVGILDVAKAAFPTWLCLRIGKPLGVAVVVGLAAMAGHNWSIYLGLQGGRGIGTALGLLLNVFPWGALWILGWIAVGRLVPKAAALPALAGFLSLPTFARWMHQPEVVVWGCWGMLLLTVLKRLEGNRKPFPSNEEPWRVLLRRLALDRDIADFDAWVRYGSNAGGRPSENG